MATYKRCSVELLCLGEKANCKGDLALTDNTKLYLCKLSYEKTDKLAHIYILSEDKDEIINTGDWYYDTEDNRIDQLREDELTMSYDRKIIATTNQVMRLPRLPKGFIEKFITTFNKDEAIEFAMVEYNTYPIGNNGNIIGTDSDYPYNKLLCNFTIKYDVKIDKGNYITIKRIKDTYTREEHIKDIKTAVQDAISYPEKFVTGICFDNSLFEKWLEENL